MKISSYQTKDYLNGKILDFTGASKTGILKRKDINLMSDTFRLNSDDTDKFKSISLKRQKHIENLNSVESELYLRRHKAGY